MDSYASRQINTLKKKAEIIIYNRSKNNLIIDNLVKYAEKNLKFSNNRKTCALHRNAPA